MNEIPLLQISRKTWPSSALRSLCVPCRSFGRAIRRQQRQWTAKSQRRHRRWTPKSPSSLSAPRIPFWRTSTWRSSSLSRRWAMGTVIFPGGRHLHGRSPEAGRYTSLRHPWWLDLRDDLHSMLAPSAARSWIIAWATIWWTTPRAVRREADRMGRSGEWVDEIVIVGTARLLNVPIFLIVCNPVLGHLTSRLYHASTADEARTCLEAPSKRNQSGL